MRWMTWRSEAARPYKTESFSRTPIDNEPNVEKVVRLACQQRAFFPKPGREAETLLGGDKLLPGFLTHYEVGKADFVAAVEQVQQTPAPTVAVPNPMPARCTMHPFIPFTLEEKEDRARVSRAAVLAKGHSRADLENALRLREAADTQPGNAMDDVDTLAEAGEVV